MVMNKFSVNVVPSCKKTYNHRAISTLAVESMFSSLSTFCQNSSSIPLAAKIPEYIAKMMQFITIQQDQCYVVGILR